MSIPSWWQMGPKHPWKELRVPASRNGFTGWWSFLGSCFYYFTGTSSVLMLSPGNWLQSGKLGWKCLS